MALFQGATIRGGTIRGITVNESEEKLKNHQFQECNGSRKSKEMVSCKTLIEEDFNSNEGCNKLFLKLCQRATGEQKRLYFSKLEKHFLEKHSIFTKNILNKEKCI